MLNPRDYETLVEQSPLMIWRAALDKKCDYFNARWLAFTGRTLAQELGDGWVEGVHPDDVARCFETYVAAFDRHETFEMRYRLRRADGAYRWILDRGVPFFAPDGSFAGYIGSCIDVNATVEAEEERRVARDAEISRLAHLLPVCAWCHKIRDDAGYWQQIEEYVASAQLGRVTHGICDACASQVDPDGPVSVR